MPKRRLFLFVCIIAALFTSTAALGFPGIQTYRPWFLLSPQSSAGLTAIGTPLTENFDSLSNDTTVLSSTLPDGWAFLETGTNADGLYAANSGASSGGQTYSYGTTGSTERAFGQLRSGALVSTLGASFVNNTGSTITGLDISYIGEQWRLGAVATGRQDRMDFQYSLDATSLSTGSWTDFDALDFASPITTGSVGALNGNSAANRTAKSGTISSLTIPNGSTIWIRWNDLDAASSDDGLAIDDFSITPQASAPVIQISDLNFGNVLVGSATSMNVTVQNTGTADLVLGTASITGVNGSDFSVPTSPSGTTITPGNSLQVEVQFTAMTRGLRSASLTLSSNASGGDNVSSLTGTGVAPQVGLSTSSIAFGNQNVGTTSASMALTISNNGDTGQNLWIGSLPISGTNSGDFSITDAPAFPASIAAGGNLTIHLTFTPGAAGSRGATLTVNNNDPSNPMPTVGLGGAGIQPGTVSFSSASFSVGEGDGMATITVDRTGGSDGAVTVDYSTASFTATGGASCVGSTDFINASGTLSFADGETSKTFDVAVCDDAIVESNESAALSLSNATGGAVIGMPNPATLIINDNEPAPTTVDLSSGTYQAVEGNGEVAITLVRGGDTSTVFTVNLATADSTATAGTCGSNGADYESVLQTVSFGTGDLTKVVSVPVCSDLFSESPAESFAVSLSDPSGGVTLGSVSSASVTIIDAATEFTDTSTPLSAGPGETVSSDISVTGYVGNVSGMRVTLFGLSTAAADDLDVLLVDPAGHKYALVGDVGGGSNLNNVTLTFEDAGSAGFVPDAGPVGEGENYEPTNCESPVTDFDGSPVGAVVEPGCGPTLTNTLAGTFGGQNPNGTWTLYLRNDGGAPIGVSNISLSGWGIQFLLPTAAPVTVSGRVMNSAGEGIRGAAVTVSGGDLVHGIAVRTDAFGRYSFAGLHPGRTYIVTARVKRSVIADAVRLVTPLDNLADVDFVAEPLE